MPDTHEGINIYLFTQQMSCYPELWWENKSCRLLSAFSGFPFLSLLFETKQNKVTKYFAQEELLSQQPMLELFDWGPDFWVTACICSMLSFFLSNLIFSQCSNICGISFWKSISISFLLWFAAFWWWWWGESGGKWQYKAFKIFNICFVADEKM